MTKIGDLECITFHRQLFALTLAHLAEYGPMSHVLPAEFQLHDVAVLTLPETNIAPLEIRRFLDF